MKWKSEETLIAYQHYFDEQRNADTREQFHQRMHQEIQEYLEERTRGKRKMPTNKRQVTTSSQAMIQMNDEPNLAFLYSLAGEG